MPAALRTPDGGGGDAVVESDELAVDASVAPGGVLAGHLEYQRADRLWGGWAAWLSSRVGPAAGDELGVPAQQGSRGDEPNPAQRGGEQSAQRAEDGAVDPVHRRAGVASTQDGDLVTEHQDLDVLGCIRASEQRQPAQQTGEEQIGESEGHSRRSCCAGCGPGPRGRLSEKALVRRHDTVLGTPRVPRVSQILLIKSRRLPRRRGRPGFLAGWPAQGMGYEIWRR
jgi:hypothetical protein